MVEVVVLFVLVVVLLVDVVAALVVVVIGLVVLVVATPPQTNPGIHGCPLPAGPLLVDGALFCVQYAAV